MKKAAIIGLIVLTGCNSSIEQQVVQDSIDQYNIVKDPMEKCVYAGIVAAACTQAKDQNCYNKWNEIEKSDCKAAGMPQ